MKQTQDLLADRGLPGKSTQADDHRWARSSFLEGGQKIFLLEGGHKKLKQRGSGGSHSKKFMAGLALFGQELVPA